MFEIWNRRYTGSKLKLVDWIDELIEKNCKGNSFCDIFAGTGVVTSKEINKFDKIIINDFLYSNNVIYNAFFLKQEFNETKMNNFIFDLLSIDLKDIGNNYFGDNFGDRYFSAKDAKTIGYIREQIEVNKKLFNYKEYCILLASLIYSADKIANTVGHYEAYIKGKEIKDGFNFIFIKPYETNEKTIEIYREDANKLAKEIYSDIVYIDPPYNSRQYSRFYHVLETLVKYDGPKLYGAALKPAPENMSDYCRNSAVKVFEDLINSLNCKYIVVSYNNTYNSKSTSSRNKIELDDMKDILKKRGNLKTFEKNHSFFNAGKTEFQDHKEYIFIVEVNNG